MEITKETVVRASSGQVSAKLDHEAIILGLSSGQYFGLDGVGLLVWELLAEAHTVADLQSAILADFEVPKDRCFNDLCDLLDALEREDLIERVVTS